ADVREGTESVHGLSWLLAELLADFRHELSQYQHERVFDLLVVGEPDSPTGVVLVAGDDDQRRECRVELDRAIEITDGDRDVGPARLRQHHELLCSSNSSAASGVATSCRTCCMKCAARASQVLGGPTR